MENVNQKGNNESNGNNCSKGNNCSDGNNCSKGNNWSDGNNCSKGNNYSDGNNWSDGNNCSIFLNNCKGTHECVFCSDKNGISYEIFNQKFDETKVEEFKTKILKLLDGWLPHTTNYQELRKKGWNKEHNDDNVFVTELVKNEDTNNQYHDAWNKLCVEKKIGLFKLIRDTKWLPKDKFEVLTMVTGLRDMQKAQPELDLDNNKE